ncbi:MAG: M55 family metallopeptidase [Anaerolineales bacterium]|jgi:D-amino peptidase|nr:M55 family metallopeptidase [Anaerolineales bacterium]
MKILIAADMEGITGVTHWDQVSPSHSEYPRFRRLMTADVNAAIRGAFAGGAESVSVTDGHNNSRNILIEELDERAVLNTGSPMPLSMVQGVDQGVAGVCYVGYHARMGAQRGILDHTWSDERVANLWVNGQLFGESALNGGVCGHFDVPVIMVSGDQTVCAEVRAAFGDVETAVVKQAIGRMAAECLPPAVSGKLIEEAARRAVERLKIGEAPPPLKISAPITMVLELVQSEMADKAMLMPGAARLEDRKVQYIAADMPILYAAFRTLLALAR